MFPYQGCFVKWNRTGSVDGVASPIAATSAIARCAQWYGRPFDPESFEVQPIRLRLGETAGRRRVYGKAAYGGRRGTR
jgi:hypothetical protein